MLRSLLLSSLFFLVLTAQVCAQQTGLLFSSADRAALLAGIKNDSLFSRSYSALLVRADKAVRSGIQVPVPRDPAGGYTHARHKQNYLDALDCGIAWHITRDTAYAVHVRDVLLKYASMYEKLPLHPARVKGHPAGKIFWQNLNDCVWQVYMIQAYDCIRDFLSPAQKEEIERHLFYPVVHFLMVDNPEVFNKVHNHGTWSDAAVGITGYVLHKPEWVKKALHGSRLDDKTGFLAQINQLFSPDGYYTEGPYYERYALMPFMLFAMAIQRYQPTMHIFAYRDSVLVKAVRTCLQLTYNKHFFPVNDAIRAKTYVTEELVYGVDIAYAYGHGMNDLLSIAAKQGSVLVSDIGLKTAAAIAAGKAAPFGFKSAWFRDGPDGREGGIGVLRYRDRKNNFCAVLKATALGMGHGHFDKLNLLVYDNGHEIIPDYASARFINIASKEGGRYLPENNSWAKQTIAHNTVTVDETSDYNGSEKTGSTRHSDLVYFKAGKKVQVLSCTDTTAYPGVKLTRTLVLLKPDKAPHPLLIDLFETSAKKPHRYDLAYYYRGDIIATDFPVTRYVDKLLPYGDRNGYQYLWHTGQGMPDSTASVTFLQGGRFYTLTTAACKPEKLDFVMTGSHDPHADLLTQKGFILSRANAADQVFLSVLEPHGEVNESTETTSGAGSAVRALRILSSKGGRIRFELNTDYGNYSFVVNSEDPDHFISIKKAG